MGVASIAVRGGATAMKVAKGAMYVARAADLASNVYAFCVGAHDTAEQIKTIQQKLYNGESVSDDEYGRMALSAICTVISGVSTAASLKGFGTVDDDLALLASKYKKVAPEIDNPTTTKMTGGVDKTPDVQTKYDPYAIMKERGIPQTLSDEEIAACRAVNLQMNANIKIRACDDSNIITDPSRLLGTTANPQDHHIIPAFRGKSKPYADFIKNLGIDVDQYTITVSGGKGGMHMNFIHGKGKWNQKWMNFIDDNPNATAKDIYQFAGKMMDDYGLSGLKIHPYGK